MMIFILFFHFLANAHLNNKYLPLFETAFPTEETSFINISLNRWVTKVIFLFIFLGKSPRDFVFVTQGDLILDVGLQLTSLSLSEELLEEEEEEEDEEEDEEDDELESCGGNREWKGSVFELHHHIFTHHLTEGGLTAGSQQSR